MLPMSISFPWVRSRAETRKATAAALAEKLPPKVSHIIGDYIYDEIDPTLIGEPLELDRKGRVLNPLVRENIKRILACANCLPWCKEVTINSICNERHSFPYLFELGKISQEIVAEGGRLRLDNVVLKNVVLCLNMQNASLCNFVLTDSIITGDLTGADLTGARFFNVNFEYLLFMRVSCVDLVISRCNFECVFMTGTDITDPALLQFCCVLTDPVLLHYRPSAFILNVLRRGPETHLLLHSKRNCGEPVSTFETRSAALCLIS